MDATISHIEKIISSLRAAESALSAAKFGMKLDPKNPLIGDLMRTGQAHARHAAKLAGGL